MTARSAAVLLLCVCIDAAGESVEIAWPPVPDPLGIGKYEIHWGTTPGAYTDHVGIVRWYSQATVEGLVAGTTYYFAVRSCAPDLKSCGSFGPEFGVTVPPIIGLAPMVPMLQQDIVAIASPASQ
jgi:hypothetical protein